MRLKDRTLALCFALACFTWAGAVSAQTPPQASSQPSPQAWPQRPVKFILPLGPGAGADIGARLFADRLSARWGKPVVVENRPGGDGFVAITAVLSARDDHTLLFGPAAAFTAHPFLHDKLPYDPKELVPVAKVSNTLVTITVPTSLNVGSLRELVERARAEPGKLNWATVTGSTDLIFAGFLKRTGIEMAKVPYRDTVSALNDLTEGRIQVFMAALAIVRAQAEAGKLKILAITNRQRAKAAPDVPTAKEAGYPALDFDGLVGLYASPVMPVDLRERIAADVKAVAADPAIAARLEATGQVVSTGTTAEFVVEIDEQRAAVVAIAKELGIKPAQ